ncbi:MAG: hypothetical protein WCD81_09105 [Candidatus Bathyarchaeia archaeon]
MSDDDWSVAVFKCAPENVRSVLLEFYGFLVDLVGVKNLHFLVRDRVEDEVVVSFRVLTEKKYHEVVKSKMNYKLGILVPDKFAVNPDSQNPLNKYVAWGAEKRISKSGLDKFPEFCNLLSKMSGLVIEMLKNDYFGSTERVEIAHVMSWMLGCTEYGKMSPTHWELGYYDRIEDKCRPYLRQNFPQTQKSET